MRAHYKCPPELKSSRNGFFLLIQAGRIAILGLGPGRGARQLGYVTLPWPDGPVCPAANGREKPPTRTENGFPTSARVECSVALRVSRREAPNGKGRFRASIVTDAPTVRERIVTHSLRFASSRARLG